MGLNALGLDSVHRSVLCTSLNQKEFLLDDSFYIFDSISFYKLFILKLQE